MRFDLDQPPYLERTDLIEFVRRRLVLADDPAAPTPYRGKDDLAGRVAAAVAARAYPTFLVAQLTSAALVQAGSVIDIEAPSWELAFPGSVADAMNGYLNRLAEAPSAQERRARKRRLRELLTPLVYAEGDGLPRALWPAAASALADRHYGPEELDWLLDTAADYLVEQATSKGSPVFRLYHQALADYLQPATLEEASVRQRRLASALLEQVPRCGDGSGRAWSAAHPYLTCHLASHAAVAGLLDELLDDPGFLLAADPVRLLHALSAVTTPGGRQAAGVYRLAVHQLRDRPVELAAAYLELTARQQRANDLADRIGRLGLAQPWSTRWAVWQPATPHRIIGRHPYRVAAVAAAELDGRPMVISGGQDGVRVWVCWPRAHMSLRSPATAMGSGRWRLGSWAAARWWSAAARTGCGCGSWPPAAHVAAFTGHRFGVAGVAIAQLDGRPVVVSGGQDGTVRVSELATGTQVGEPLTIYDDGVAAVAIAQLGGRPVVVSGGQDGTVRVSELATGTHVAAFTGHRFGVAGVAIAQLDGRPVVVSVGGFGDETVRVWDLATGTPVAAFTAHSGGVWAVAVADLDGRPVVISGAGGDEAVRVWELATGKPVTAFTGHGDGVAAVTVAELGGRLVVVSGGSVGTVRVWDLGAGETVGEPLTGHSFGVAAAAVAELGGRPVVVSGGYDAVRVRELATGAPVGEPFTGHSGGVWAVAVAELGGRLVVVSGGQDGTVRVWDLATGKPVTAFTGHSGGVAAVAIAQLDGRPVVVSGDEEGAVRVWELATGETVAAFTGHSRGVAEFAHSRGVAAVAVVDLDGRPVVVSGGEDGAVRVWELATGTRVAAFAHIPGVRGVAAFAHIRGVAAMAVAELDGRPLVVSGGGSGDETVRVWDLASGMQVAAFTGHSQGVAAVAAAELDGRPVVVTGGGFGDETMRVWELDAKQMYAMDTGAPILAIVCVPPSSVLLATSAGLVLVRLTWEAQNGPDVYR